MQFTVKQLPGSLIELSVEVPQDQVERTLRTVSGELSTKVNIPGFRKGHIPQNVLEKHFGKEGLLEMAADKIIQKSYADIVIKEKINVVGPVEDVELQGTNPFKFVVKAPVYPEVHIKKYDDISIKKEKVELEKDEVEKTLQELQEQIGEFAESTNAVKAGDKVEISFEGFDKDGNAIPNTKSENHPTVLGKGQFIPGFEEGFLGTTPGETKEFKVTFPKDYHAAALAGQEVHFKVTVNKAWNRVLPELNDEFVKKVRGEEMTLDAFKEEIQSELMKEKQNKEELRQEDILMKELMKRTEAEIPEVFLKQELDQMLKDQKNHMENQGIDFNMYMKDILKKEEGELKESWKETARERVLGKLIVAELLKKEEITVADEEVDTRVEEIVAGYPGEESRKKAKEIYRKEGKYYEPLREQLRMQKLVKQLLAKAVK